MFWYKRIDTIFRIFHRLVKRAEWNTMANNRFSLVSVTSHRRIHLPAALVNQSWLILPLVETWWFGRHSSRLRRYNLNGFSVATAGIDWNGLRSDAVIFSDRWTNAELAPAGFVATIFLSRRSPAFQRFVGYNVYIYTCDQFIRYLDRMKN